jgi:hypothetical protein
MPLYPKIVSEPAEMLSYSEHPKKGSSAIGEDLKVFATIEAAGAWIDENDPEGVAFEYDVLE